jgi:hypothetical protein
MSFLLCLVLPPLKQNKGLRLLFHPQPIITGIHQRRFRTLADKKGPHPDIGYAERRSPIGDHHIEEIAVPLFNEASRIYAPDEIDFLRNCVALASLKLSSTQLDETVLAERILRLYESGLRDASTICDLAVRLITPANESTDILAANGNAPHEIDLLPE